MLLPTTPGAETVTAVSAHKPMKTVAREIGTTIIMHYRLATQKMYKNLTHGACNSYPTHIFKFESYSYRGGRKRATQGELEEKEKSLA